VIIFRRGGRWEIDWPSRAWEVETGPKRGKGWVFKDVFNGQGVIQEERGES